MKKTFIYYSLTGNGDVIGEYLSNRGFNVQLVRTTEKLPKNKFFRILVGGYKAGIGYRDQLDNFNSNIKPYKYVVIGSPVWNSRLSTPINTVLDELDLTDKEVLFILYSGSGKPNKATSYLKEKYPRSTIINMKEPAKNRKELYKLDDYL